MRDRLQTLRSALLLMALIFIAPVCLAQEYEYADFMEDNVFYKILEDSTTVEVCSPNSLSGAMFIPGYSGDIVIPGSVTHNGKTYEVIGIGGGAFYRCSELTSVKIANSINYIEGYGIYRTWQGSYYAGTFGDCTSLRSVSLPKHINGIDSWTFYGCSSLDEIIFPEALTNIGDYAFSGCSSLNLTTFPQALTGIGESAFSSCTSLTEVTFPETLTYIGDYAFYNCSSLDIVTCWALFPPQIGNNTFNGTPTSMTVFVMPEAINAFQSDSQWKQLNLKPINVGSKLSINLPQESDISKYNNMKLAVSSATSNKTLHFILTDKQSYTFFVGYNTKWNVTLTNQYDDEFGKIDEVEVGEDDVSVTFPSLLNPQIVNLVVKTPNGLDVSSQVKVSWKNENGELLVQGNEIAGLPTGRKLTYTVKLPQELAIAYSLPTNMNYIVKDGDNTVICQLTSITPIQICGLVKDVTTNLPLSSATISVIQTFAGGNTKTITTTTDNQGAYSLDVLSVPTTLTVAAQGYITQTINCDSLMTSGSNVTLHDVALTPITGAVINVNLTYIPAHGEDESAEIQNWYSDYNNVDYEVYNKTTGRAITNISVQYPQIVLMEDVNDGDVLELMATSRKDTFKPVKTTVTVLEQQAIATFIIRELGKVVASFNKNLNVKVRGMLYNADNKFVASGDYIDNTLTIDNLLDGDYELITMGKSDFFNSIFNLNQFDNVGMKEGEDFVKNTMHVESGIVSKLTIDEVPFFDESKFYQTGEQTLFSVNKSRIVVGNYLTFRSQIDFKEEYIDKISDVQLIIDLPESCQVYENSVMIGSATGNYLLNGNQIIIPMTYYDDIVRFCAIPTVAGDFVSSAFVKFKLKDSSDYITQPIGCAYYNASGLELEVPTLTSITSIPISGIALSGCEVFIYDNDVLIGQTIALGNGYWSLMCDLHDPYNLSRHNIFAKVILNDVEIKSEIYSCTYDNNTLDVSVVHMLNGMNDISFDFQNPNNSSNGYYSYNPSQPNFTFTIEFTDKDTTRVSDVTLYVKTSDNNWVPLEALYDESSGLWVSSGLFYSNTLPVNVGVEYAFYNKSLVDRQRIDYEKSTIEDICQNSINDREGAINEMLLDIHDNSIYDNIEDLLNSEHPDIDALCMLLDSIIPNEVFVGDLPSDEEISYLLDNISSEYNEWKQQYNNYVDEMLDDLYFNELPSFDQPIQYVQDNRIFNYEITTLSDSELNALIQNEYEKIQMTDSSYYYCLFEEDCQDFIDSKLHTRYRIKIDETDSSPMFKQFEDDDVSIKEQVEDIIYRIKDFGNRAVHGELTISEACSTLNDMITLIQSLYGNQLILIKRHFTEKYDNIIKEFDNKITKYEQNHSLLGRKANDCKEGLIYYNNQRSELIEDIKKLERELLSDDLLPEERSLIEYELAGKKTQLQDIDLNIDDLKLKEQKYSNGLKKVDNQIKDAKKAKEITKKHKDQLKKIINKFPKTITRNNGKLAKLIVKGGQTAGVFGYIAQFWCIACDLMSAVDELNQWQELQDAIDSKMPCEKDAIAAITLHDNIHQDAQNVLKHLSSIIVSECTALGLDCFAIPGITPQWWLSQICSFYAEWAKYLIIEKYIYERGEYWLDLMYLKCTGKEPKDPRKPRKPRKRFYRKSNDKDRHPSIDPSGFVYEGVPSNRLQGVTATCYYKETVEDMYGDTHEEVVLWDAEQYGQENPLLTDENGYYRWDVPIGMWQVKYEKVGYETTYSDWLPVPPPQLDVNIGMVQMRQPEVIKAHAYPQAVELEFDKFMIPETLTTDNITVSVNGTAVSGNIELLNAEKDDPLAITSIRRAPGTGLTFASRVRFNANQPFNADQVTLHVKQDVKSYADLQMNEDYEVTLPIEYEMEKIVADSTFIVPYGDSRTLTVTVMPAMASKGKTLNVRTTSPMIISTKAETYTLDSNGQAVVTVYGDLPGMGSLLFGVDGYDLSAATLVNVKMESEMTVATPTASIASGSEVEKGTAVYLSCSTEGATIYYTLDGSCPCDNTTARKVYDGTPIIINTTTTIKAMATAPDLFDSDVATFIYRVSSGLRGDVNGDGEVNIADVNALIDIILGGAVDEDTRSRADVNGDSEVNIADINALIDIILSPSNRMRMKVNCSDLLHMDDVTMLPGDVRTINVTLDDANSYSAMQCDVVLPAGLTLIDISSVEGHISKTDVLDESTMRAVSYSMDKRSFLGDEFPVMSLTVHANAALGTESEIKLTHVVLADATNKAWRVEDCTARVCNATGVNDLTACIDRVWVEGNTLCIETRQDGVARIATINGVTYDLDVKAGVNRYDLDAGVYVVVINGKGHKIVVK